MFVLSIIAFVVALLLLGFAIAEAANKEHVLSGVLVGAATLVLFLGIGFQVLRVIPTQYVGITRSSVTQELAGPYEEGVVLKPFFGTVYHYPASKEFEACYGYNPAIRGSYGIKVNLCHYFNVREVDWLKEINTTGKLDASSIMSTWRNSTVRRVADVFKGYSPELLSQNSPKVEQDLFERLSPWYAERGITLVRVSFANWEFASEQVAKDFDASITKQRRIAEEQSLAEAAKIARQRQLYEAETQLQVAEKQRAALDELGINDDDVVQYMWMKAMTEADKVPDVLILGSSDNTQLPVAVPSRK